MTILSSLPVSAVVLGIGATATMDLCGWALQRALGVPMPDYGMVGRWVGHMARGRFRHAPIAKSAPIARERPLGWIVHYGVGVLFASILLATWGVEWLRQPTLAPALLVGLGSVAAPFLLMQPAMGLGLAARRTANPSAARSRSLLNHGLFALGLYAAAQAARWIAGA